MRLRTALTAIAASALTLCVYNPPWAKAQTVLPFTAGEPAPIMANTDDVGNALLVKHVGTGASGTIAVTAGDLLFKDGAEGAEVATTDITGCGGTAGTLDVDNAACDTIGELVDRCNVSAKWRCVAIDAIRSDSTSGAKFLTLAAIAATSEAGRVINWDTSVALHETRCLGCPRSISSYLSTGGGSVNPRQVPNVFAGKRVILFYFDATSTYASGTSTLQVISVKPKNDNAGGSESTNLPSTSGTGGLVYTTAGGATTANKVAYDKGYGLRCEKDSRCLVRINNSAALSAILIQAYGTVYSYRSVEGVNP